MAGIVFGAAGLLSLVFLLRFCVHGPSWSKSVFKTAAVALLAVAAWSAGGPIWLVAALALGAAGDFCLSRHSENWFLGGVAAFALAHLAYVVLLQDVIGHDVALIFTGWRALVALILICFAATMAWLLWPSTGESRWPVMIYLCIITAMGFAALALPVVGLAMLAALLFIVSDAVLAAELFLILQDHAAPKRTPYAVWLTYWSAQALFCWVFALA